MEFLFELFSGLVEGLVELVLFILRLIWHIICFIFTSEWDFYPEGEISRKEKEKKDKKDEVNHEDNKED